MSLKKQLSLCLFCLLPLLGITAGVAVCGAESFLKGAVDSSPSELTVPVTFRVVFSKPIDLHKMSTGTEISGRLKEDLRVNNKVVAAAGSVVTGYVQRVDKQGSDPVGITEKKRRHSACRVIFDEIILGNKQRLKLEALPVETISVFNNQGEFRSITVGPGGVIKKVESLDVFEPGFDLVLSRSMIESGMCFKTRDEIEVRNNYKASNERIASKVRKSEKNY